MRPLVYLYVFMCALMILLTSCGSNHYLEGPKGKDGFSSLINVYRGETLDCELGTLIETGLDLNQNGTLDEEEIENFSFVCDGEDGKDGIIKIRCLNKHYKKCSKIIIK